MDFAQRVRGSLLGGALGDALGWPVEFQRLEQIRAGYGPAGLTDLADAGRGGQVTDDTQMTLFTAEGLLRGGRPEDLHAAYRRWFLTQRLPGPGPNPDGWLAAQEFLYASRAPGNACTTGIATDYRPAAPFGQDGPVNPASKGCGTVMRSAPFGLVGPDPEQAFQRAAVAAQLTHGHPTGYLAAGAFAALVAYLAAGVPLRPAVDAVLARLDAQHWGQETGDALRRAVRIAAEGPGSAEAVERVGLGWIAEECLAIAVYAALVGADARAALVLAVNHSGDSDSTGAVCGNLVGAVYGLSGLPADWCALVEGREVVLQVADDLVTARTPGDRTALAARYPLPRATAVPGPAAPPSPAPVTASPCHREP
ncbi:ADP-ribosylglycohydrolase family protein [Kitasatospora sp. NA04385]|uniref:ADP-ribosylglycohydrolase family protein n=1 Tax=Kitasatospora sp. NA04385 TaxID=2742135 RepID=UPI0015901734|nr:ADP-ribosylglycohydrolase family protein [Kitasatospora sp. NA04385]QKW20009.1 ADP-ribosylglycohydrolase family protein [Kitasatospora sp. NA04385]